MPADERRGGGVGGPDERWDELRWDLLPEEVRDLYPWRGDDFRTPDGPVMHYVDAGPKDGPVLLMLHGNPTWSFYWREYVKAFQDTHRCVVPDHLGHGLSDRPKDWSWRLADHAKNVVALMEHLDLRDVTLMVHDWGGAIGLLAACDRPERIARLVIFNTSVFLEHVPLSIRLARLPGFGELFVQGCNGFLGAALYWCTSDRSRLAGAVGAGYKAPYHTWRGRLGHLKFIRDIPVEASHPTHAAIARTTAEVPVKFAQTPTLFLWGDGDFVFTPAFLEKWKKLLPHGEAHRFADASHWVIEDARDRILPLLHDFFRRHPVR